MEIKDKWLIDNTALTNFALVGELELLATYLKDILIITQEVKNEFQDGIIKGKIPKENQIEWLSEVFFDNDDELLLYERLSNFLGKGESSCLSIAANRGWKIVTDDIDARKIAQREETAVTGTIGILVYLIINSKIELKTGNDILRRMVEAGFYSPVDSLDEFIK